MGIQSQKLRDLNADFRIAFTEAFNKRAVYWPKKAMRIDSKSDTNVYAWLAEMEDFKEWIGSRTVQKMVARDHTIRNKDWEFTFSVKRRDIEFDNLGIYAKKAEHAGNAAKRLWDNRVTEIQKAGVSTLCWDGQFFYDTDHPVNKDDAAAGTYANRKTSFALSADNFDTAYTDMMTFKGENGQELEIIPTLLEVPPQLRKTAREILHGQSIFQSDANGAAAPTNVLAGDVDLVVNPKLASEPGVWYLHAVHSGLAPFVVQVGQEPTALIGKTNPDDENVFNRNEYVWGSDAYGEAGYGLPQLSMRCEA